MSNVIIVSNRLPITVKKAEGKLSYYPSVGGLATGLSSYVTQKKNQWIGWPGIADEELTEKDKRAIVKELAKSNCHPVFLTKKQLDDFYNGYSNSILWPLLHSLPFTLDHYNRYWKSYREINILFADVVAMLAQTESNIWVHDYQLMLLPALLRADMVESNIGFFLHIPFPSTKLFSQLPDGDSIIAGLLGADLVGFHTTSYSMNFLDNTAKLLPEATVSSKEIIIGPRVVRVTEFPIGIDYNKFSLASSSARNQKAVKKLRKKYGRKKIILTVDRLDPTKGFMERLRAYKELLKSQPELHRKVVMVMLAVPSRTEIAAYKKLKTDVEKLVNEINFTFGTNGWKPIDYMYTSLHFDDLTALYQVADIAFITPIKDGMNLVAKEYLASKPKRDGVLILSETAGAAEELTNALLVNPSRRKTMVHALNQALFMPKRELKQRVTSMQDYLKEHTIDTWAGSFIDTLQKPVPLPRITAKKVTYPIRQELLGQYFGTEKRQLFLDYDGVLRAFMQNPSLATPTKALSSVLERLSLVPHTEVVIISGRKQEDLEKWFGKLNVSLIAEHGAAIRKRGHSWHTYSKLAPDWKFIPKLVLEKFAAETPGAFIEEKDSGLVWHYRNSPPYYAQKNIVIMKQVLKKMLRGTELKLFSGNKIMEIKSRYTNKGEAARKLLKKDAEFVLAIGDDYTDEEMFSSLQSDATTIKVGSGRTKADYRLDSTEAVLDFLNALTS